MLRLFVFASLQVLILLMTVIVRHHDEKYPNIIEIVNEVSYLVIILLIIFYQRSEFAMFKEFLNNSIIGTTMLVFGISIINLICQIVIFCYSKKRKINIKPPTKMIMAKKKRRSLDTEKENPVGSTTKKPAENMEIQEGFFDESGSRTNKTNSQRKFVGFDEIIIYPLFKKSKFLNPRSQEEQGNTS